MAVKTLPALFRDGWSIPSAGDAYMIPAAGGSITATLSETYWVRRRTGEIPVLGARRVENVLARANSLAGGWPSWDPRAWTSTFGSGAIYQVEGSYPGPTGRPEGAVRVRRPDTAGLFRSLYCDFNQAVASTYLSRIGALWARSLTGSVCNLGLVLGAGNNYVAVPTTWTRIAHTTAIESWGGRVGIASPGSGAVDVLIAIEEGWRAQVEVYQGTYRPHGAVPCEPVDPAIDYSLIDGCGGLGIRYFDTYNGNTLTGSNHVVAGQGARIPDVWGIMARPSATNLVQANNPVSSSSPGAYTQLALIDPMSIYCGDFRAVVAAFDTSLGLDFWRRLYWAVTPNSGTQFGLSVLVKAHSLCTHCIVYNYQTVTSGAATNLYNWVPLTGSSPYWSPTPNSNWTVAAEPMGNGWWWLKAIGGVSSGATSVSVGVAPSNGGTGSVQTHGSALLVAGPTLYQIAAVGPGFAPFPMISQSASAACLGDLISINSLNCGSRFTILTELYVPTERGRGAGGLSQRLITEGNAAYLPTIFVNWTGGGVFAQVGSASPMGTSRDVVGIARVALVVDGPFASFWVGGVCTGSSQVTSGMVVRHLSSAPSRAGNVAMRDCRIWPDWAAHTELAQAMTLSGSVI